MRKISSFLLGCTVTLGMATAKGACTFPDEVDIPDGATASEEQMLAGRDAVQQYMATMNEYLSCLDEEATAVTEEETPEQKQMHVARHNAAVEQMETLAAQFNEQLRAYKSRD
jgi:hypothetical protein